MKHGYNFFMHDFQLDFQNMTKIVLNSLNVIDSEENRQRIQQNVAEPFNISNERASLSEFIQSKCDVVNAPQGQQIKKHVSSLNSNLKDLQIKTLLNIGQNRIVCTIIKNMTLLLQSNWKYYHIC